MAYRASALVTPYFIAAACILLLFALWHICIVTLHQIATWVGEQNLTILTTYPFYLGGLGFTKEIDDPANPTLKRGLKLRIPSMVTFRHMIEGLGYIPTPIAWGDTFTAM